MYFSFFDGAVNVDLVVSSLVLVGVVESGATTEMWEILVTRWVSRTWLSNAGVSHEMRETWQVWTSLYLKRAVMVFDQQISRNDSYRSVDKDMVKHAADV